MPPLISDPTKAAIAEPSLAERALQAVGPLQQQEEATRPGIGDIAKVMIPIVGALFAGQLRQKVQEHQQVQALQQGLAQSLTQQGLYHLLPAIHGKLTDKGMDDILQRMSLANAAAMKPFKDAMAAKQEFMQKAQQPTSYQAAPADLKPTSIPPGPQLGTMTPLQQADRKSTRLNSSH